MTTPSIDNVSALIAKQVSPHFPSKTKEQPDTERLVAIQLDSKVRADLDNNGVSDDFVGTGFLIVTEKTGTTGWFGSTTTTQFAKRFAYFLKDGKDLVLRELNVTQNLNYEAASLQKIPKRCFASSSKSGGTTCTVLTTAEAQAWAIAASKSDPISVFIGNIDSRPGNEIELSRGIYSLGIANIASDLPF